MGKDSSTACPSQNELQSLLDAKTEVDVVLQRHVESCEKCVRLLEELCHPEVGRAWAAVLESAESEGLVETIRVDLSARTLSGTSGSGLEQSDDSETITPALPSIDGYEVHREIGRGGMGLVYAATQLELGRDVAIKMLLSGALAGPERMERFQREARALAKISHPNIVQIFEVGQHQGAPYLVLEYVDGGSLDDQLDGDPWNPRAATQLIRQVAEGVHAAHEMGFIHRDLKPANLLLSRHGQAEGTWNPKITDFGLVKHDDEGSLTRSGVAVGTPRYLSPEQAIGDEKRIRRESDVYAIGCILYQLLTGRTPFQSETIAETIRQICEDEPLEVRQLNRSVPVDLATICMKCLRKAPEQRYPSACALSEDLQRFETAKPILARPVSRLEKAGKWARRNPVVSSLGLLVFIATVLLLVMWVDFTRRLAEQTRIAEAKAAEALANENVANDSASATNEILNFLTMDLLQAVSPGASGRDVRVYDVLMAADKELESRFEGREGVEAAVRQGIAESLEAIGQYQDALPQAERAVVLYQRASAPSETQFEAKMFLVSILSTLSETEAALALLDELQATEDNLNEEQTLDLREQQGSTLFQAGRFVDARDLFQRLHEEVEATAGPDHEDTIRLLGQLARATHECGDKKGAQVLLIQYRDRTIAKHGESDLRSLSATRSLGVSYSMTGKLEEALEMQRESHQICLDVYGPDHPETNSVLHNYAMVLSRSKRYEEALPLLEKAVEHSVTHLGSNHETTINYVGNLAYMHFEFGHADRAADVLEEHCDPLLPEAYPHPNWAILLLNYGRVRERLGELDEAQTLLQKSKELMDQSNGTTELMRKTLDRSLARLKQRMERRVEKKETLEKSPPKS
ncbi:MAG: serine/threonine-protein kinase [Planctomycetota bacterium]